MKLTYSKATLCSILLATMGMQVGPVASQNRCITQDLHDLVAVMECCLFYHKVLQDGPDAVKDKLRPSDHFLLKVLQENKKPDRYIFVYVTILPRRVANVPRFEVELIKGDAMAVVTFSKFLPGCDWEEASLKFANSALRPWCEVRRFVISPSRLPPNHWQLDHKRRWQAMVELSKTLAQFCDAICKQERQTLAQLSLPGVDYPDRGTLVQVLEGLASVEFFPGDESVPDTYLVELRNQRQQGMVMVFIYTATGWHYFTGKRISPKPPEQ